MAEIPTYTIEQLADLNLPGYGVPATLPDIANPNTDWNPVLSVSVFRRNPETHLRQILTGVRCSNTHDGVASTPTGRFRKPCNPYCSPNTSAS